MPEASHRLYSCARCAQLVQICRRCDRGNRYCAEGCAGLGRRESLRRAGSRYQRSFTGACRHAARQRAWRARQANKVTHQGSAEPGVAATVAATSIDCPEELRDEPIGCAATRSAAFAPRRRAGVHCSFCGRPLSAFTRLGFLRAGP